MLLMLLLLFIIYEDRKWEGRRKGGVKKICSAFDLNFWHLS